MASEADRLSEALPAYFIGEELGRGAFGVVYAAEHRQMGRRVAVKALSAHEPGVRARFLTEAKTLASLDHPHVVPLYDYVEAGDLCLLVMERLDGGTLADRFFAPRRIDIATACAVAMVTCAGLHHAHRRGVLHRDIKPENLLFSADDVLKVTDFGIAKVVGLGGEDGLSTIGGVKGTPAYMAPEQVSGEPLGPGVDIYATGIMLYELLAGRLPFPEQGAALAVALRHLSDEPEPLEVVAPELEGPLAEVTMRALNKDPADRFASAEHFGVAIGEAASRVLGEGWLDASKVAILTPGRILDSAQSAIPAALATIDAGRTVRVRRSRPTRPVAGTGPGAGAGVGAGRVPPPPPPAPPGSGSLPPMEPEPAHPGLTRLVVLGVIAAAVLVAAVVAIALHGGGTPVAGPSTTTTTTSTTSTTSTTTTIASGSVVRQCRNDSLGFTVTVPGYVYGSPADDSAVLGSCEALDARPLKSGDDLSAGVVTAPIVFTRLADTLDNMKSQDAGGTSHFTTVANQRALVIENRLSSDDGPFKAGSRTYTYYVDTSPTVFVGQLLISPLESSAAYAAHKQIMDTIMSSLEFNPASICKNLHVPKCGEFYFTQNVTAAPVMVTASVAPSTVHVGDTVTLTIKASDTDADVFSCIPFFAGPHVNLPATGPGSSLLDRIRDRGAAGGAFGPWDVPAAKGGSTTLTYTNKYTAAGQYQAGADCFVDNSNAKAKGDPYDPWHASGSGQVNVTVS